MKFSKGQRPHNFKEMTGMRFGMLVVRELSSRKTGQQNCWVCDCDCGNELTVQGWHLRNGQHSCGCSKNVYKTHGLSDTRVFKIWSGMLQRCTNPKVRAYQHYGARGISVCDRWRRFEDFLADMGDAPAEHSIERVDNDRGYEPGNCKWLPQALQAQNRRGNVYLDVGGKTICVAEASRRTGIGEGAIRWRIRKGWPVEKILAVVR